MRRNQVQGHLTEQELALPIARYIEDWNCMAERVGAEKADLVALTDRARSGPDSDCETQQGAECVRPNRRERMGTR